MSRLAYLVALFLLVACQSTPRGDSEKRFYSYVDAQGNLVTVERDGDEQVQRDGSERRDAPQDGSSQQEQDETIQERATEDSSGAGNKDFMDVRPENYQSTGEARQRMREEINENEKDRFVTYRGPEGEMITRPLNMKAEREAAERREKENRPEFERLPEGERYKEGTSRVPADCCRHLTEGARVLKADTNFRLDFDTARVVRLDVERPARALRLGPGVGAHR